MNRISIFPAGLRATAFTLIELLVVISIIALLAGLVVGLAPAAGEKKIRGRAQALLQEVTSAIENYKAEKGFYPPDNAMDPARPPLYYELKGAVRDAQGTEFEVQDGSQQTLTAAQLAAAFGGQQGIVNSHVKNTDGDAGLARDFYPNLTPAHVRTNGDIKFVAMPYRGTNGEFNPVIYNVSTPTHNPKSYDLLIKVVIGNKTNDTANWE